MATGDYHHTALAVARDVGMIPPEGKRVIIIQKTSEAQDLPGLESLGTSVAPAGPLQPSASAVSAASEPQVQAETFDSAHQGLVFHTDDGSIAEHDALQALSLLAQVYFTLDTDFCPHYRVISCNATAWLGRLTH